MEDAWRAKCSSTWTPPPSLPPPSPSPAPPLPSSSANQKDKNPQQSFHPFVMQGTNPQNRPAAQDPLVLHTLNLDLAKSGKTELGNSFLALLSANPNYLATDFSQLAKPHAYNGNIIVGNASSGAQVTSIPSLQTNSASGSFWTAKNSLLVESRPSLLSNSVKAPALCSSIQAAASHCYASASSKPVMGQAFPVVTAGRPSISCSLTNNYRPENTNNHNPLNIQTLQRMPTEVSSTMSSQDSARSRGRPRVFCMNTVGELFLNESGILGVICFCHGMRMSVGKFCEHSGSSANPGEAVCLENGMTVARWRKLCFGNNSPDDCKGWDWSDRPSTKDGLAVSRGSTLPILPQNPAIVDPVRTFVGLGKSGDLWNKSLYEKPPSTVLQQDSKRNPADKVSESMYQQNRLEGEGFTSPSRSHATALAKDRTLPGTKSSHDYLNRGASRVTVNKKEQNAWSRLVANRDNSKEKMGTPSLLYPLPDANSYSCEFNSNRNSFGSEASKVYRDGHSSNIDLRLGQPSQIHTSLNSFSTAVNTLQFGAAFNHQKSQIKPPLTEKTVYPLETRRTSFEPSISTRGQSQNAVGSSDNSTHSEPKELTGAGPKSPLISLFHSHITTGKSTVVNDSKCATLDSTSGKCTLSKCVNDINGGYERNNLLDVSDLFNKKDKGKCLINFENGSSDTGKADYMVHNKQAVDTRVLTPATDGQCLPNSSSVDNWLFSSHFNQLSSTLQTKPKSVNFSRSEKISFGGIRDHCGSATNSSTNLVFNAVTRPGLMNSGTPENLALSNPLHISEITSAPTHAKSMGHNHPLSDDKMKILALRHVVELSKQDWSNATFEMNRKHHGLCCHSGVKLWRNIYKCDSGVPEDLRQRNYCDIYQNASDFAVIPLQPCSNCLSGNDGKSLAAKTGRRGQNGFCKATHLTPKISHCSKGQDISTRDHCCADGYPCLRLVRMSNYGLEPSGSVDDQKEQTTCCCCSVLSKHLAGCCFAGCFCFSDSSNKQHICDKNITQHRSQASDEINMTQDRKSVNICKCMKNRFVMKNDCQTGQWRDVPAKKTGHSDATSVDMPVQVLKACKGTGNQLPGTADKEFEETQLEFDSVNEQQMSNVCSDSSAPAVTEISIEVNKISCRATNIEANKTAYVVDDEGSGAEKCGSSDEALDSRQYEEDPAVNRKVCIDKYNYSLPSQSSGNLMDELILESSSNKKRVENPVHVQPTDHEMIKKRKISEAESRKKQMKGNTVDAPVSESGLYPTNSESAHCISYLNCEFTSHDKTKAPSQPEILMQKSSVKRKRSSLSSTEPISLKAANHHNIVELDKLQTVDNDQSVRTLPISFRKEELNVQVGKESAKQKVIDLDSEKPPKYMSLSRIAKSNSPEMEIVDKKIRPVVCGRSGIISSGGLNGQKKPPKFVSLCLILKRSKRCDTNESGAKRKKMSTIEASKALVKAGDECCNELSFLKLQHENKDSRIHGKDTASVRMFGTNIRCYSGSDEDIDEFSKIQNGTDGEANKDIQPVSHNEFNSSQRRPRYKEVRKCSLSKLLGKDKHATKLSHAPTPRTNCSSTVLGAGDQPKVLPSTATGVSLGLDDEDHGGELSPINMKRFVEVQKSQPLFLNSDRVCCVCGSSNIEEYDCILECNRCSIKVHQACYGVSKTPRGHWFCRPCKSNSQNTVCVLCGYEGGAMTKAVKSQNIVKSLLKAWSFGSFMKSFSSSETMKGESLEPCLAIEASKCDLSGSVSAVRSACSEAFLEANLGLISANQTNNRVLAGLQLYNSITAGILDPSITQWVHMVCGLWTPGTQCPNVNTMNAFDVSGATAARKSIVCSICNRPGGCCIRCRVLKCSVHFHPWCAHQKGLLQSEIEGDNNEKVGFYGRCMLHAGQDGIHVDPVGTEVESPKKDWSCARTEGFEGRKSEGFKLNHRGPNDDNGGCIVSQEQINAWLHINGQKSCTRATVKPSCSDIEYDFRKEYFRYKQSKTWKHLVVYKSGIHALGLYTSQLIARGAMVVEYVGEIVGLRVADKRETEYQSGRRLQYKSACYFFRIDKEHIIDATRKGGIARFVNHSCEPNCVAKVISIRNDKKVVFFAERDINPGEEITYDYHFNSEDEGQKIPCYCNSTNCRQSLN